MQEHDVKPETEAKT